MGSQGGEHPHSTALQRPLGACSIPSAAAPFQETLGEEKIKKSYFFHSQLERGQILQQDAFLFYFILFCLFLASTSRRAPAAATAVQGQRGQPAESPARCRRRGPAASPRGCHRGFALKTLQCFVLPLIQSIWSKCSFGASCQAHKLFGRLLRSISGR